MRRPIVTSQMPISLQYRSSLPRVSSKELAIPSAGHSPRFQGATPAFPPIGDGIQSLFQTGLAPIRDHLIFTPERIDAVLGIQQQTLQPNLGWHCERSDVVPLRFKTQNGAEVSIQTLFLKSTKPWDTHKGLRPTILFVHGNLGITVENETLFKSMLDNGFNVYLFQMPGFGPETGEDSTTPSEQNCYDSVSEAIQDLYKQLPNGQQRIYLFGHSLGGGAAAGGLDTLLQQAQVDKTTEPIVKAIKGFTIAASFRDLKTQIAEIKPNLKPLVQYGIPDSFFNTQGHLAHIVKADPGLPFHIIYFQDDAKVQPHHAEDLTTLLRDELHAPCTYDNFDKGGHQMDPEKVVGALANFIKAYP